MQKPLFKYGGIVACMLLVGCETATTTDYNAALNTWLGQTERDLVMRWGIPDSTYQVDSKTRLISYRSHRRIYYPGSYSNCYGHRGYRDPFWDCTGGFPPAVQYLSCETTFTVVTGKITFWQHTGNDCRA